MKILIIHDRFQFRGGAERLILILAKALNADLMTEFWEPDSFDIPRWLQCRDAIHRVSGDAINGASTKQKLFILDKGEHPQIVLRYFRAQFNFLFKTKKIIQNYDTILFSGNNCLTASFNCKRGTRKILYCHSPVRHVYDLKEKCRNEQTSAWKKFFYYNLGSYLIRFIYGTGIRRMHQIIANSHNIKNRLKNFVKINTNHVIYPPIDIDKFVWLGQKDYYLSFGRVERLKRIPDIVSAFQKMPDKKLIVVSGGPDLEKIKDMAKNYNNIQVIGWVSDSELKEYIGNCIATIYIPIDEDFGMTPLESNAAGKPCIGVNEGGLKETILNEKTGKLIPANYTTSDLIDAVNWMTPERASNMRNDCESQASKFSAQKFVKQIKSVIHEK